MGSTPSCVTWARLALYDEHYDCASASVNPTALRTPACSGRVRGGDMERHRHTSRVAAGACADPQTRPAAESMNTGNDGD